MTGLAPCPRTIGALGVASCLVLGVGAAPAAAGTFPGPNGVIAFAIAGDDRVNIRAVDPRGGRPWNLVTSPPGRISAYTDWSPDGRLLAFDSDRTGAPEIYLRRPDGTIRRLTHNPATDVYPTWTPDGRRIAFESDRSGSKQIHVINRAGTRVRQVTHFGPGAEEPSYSPTGRHIVFLSGPVRRTALFVVRPNGTGLRRLTPRWLNAGHPSWSPDGRRVVFNSNIEKPKGRIWVVGLDGKRRRLTSGPRGVEDFEPTFSPDGRFIAFASFGRASRGGTHPDADIWAMRANGTRLRNLTPHSRDFELAPSWQPRPKAPAQRR